MNKSHPPIPHFYRIAQMISALQVFYFLLDNSKERFFFLLIFVFKNCSRLLNVKLTILTIFKCIVQLN